jgi:phosphatidate cytidylyltransferase
MSQIKQNNQEKKSFLDRIWVSIVAIPIVGALVWLGGPWFTLLAVVWSMGCAWEFYNLVRHAKGLSPLIIFGMLWVGLLIASPHFTRVPHFGTLSPTALILTAGVMFSLLISLWRRTKDNAFASWAWTQGGILYLGWLTSYLVWLRNSPDGRGWVFLAILCTFASDSSAYLVGRKLGRHKMAPFISPKKSWEGAAAGLLGAMIASPIISWYFNLPLTIWQAIMVGLLVSLGGQLGDLVKSLFKRNMEVKDSGHILPGHGGFLDRMDSLIFAGLVVYFVMAFLAG